MTESSLEDLYDLVNGIGDMVRDIREKQLKDSEAFLEKLDDVGSKIEDKLDRLTDEIDKLAG